MQSSGTCIAAVVYAIITSFFTLLASVCAPYRQEISLRPNDSLHLAEPRRGRNNAGSQNSSATHRRSASLVLGDDRFSMWPSRFNFHVDQSDVISRPSSSAPSNETNQRPTTNKRRVSRSSSSEILRIIDNARSRLDAPRSSSPSTSFSDFRVQRPRGSVLSLDSGVVDIADNRRLGSARNNSRSNRHLKRTLSAPNAQAQSVQTKTKKAAKRFTKRSSSAIDLKASERNDCPGISEADELPIKGGSTSKRSTSVEEGQNVPEMSSKTNLITRLKLCLTCCCKTLSLRRSRNRKSHGEIEGLKTETPVDFHRISLPQLCSRYQTDITYGLTEATVQVRNHTYGLNKIRPPPELPEWLKYGKKLVDRFCILLWIGSILCFVAYAIERSSGDEAPNDNLYLGCVLAIVVIIAGSFSYYQEWKSTKIMKSFEKFMPRYATVIRRRLEQQLPVEELVTGDIILLKAGDQIPADCRVVKAINFKVDNSCVTGESEPQLRTPDCSSDNPLESRNVVFFSTFSVEGSATAVVVATGDQTVMGRMARLTTGLKQKQMPIAKELDQFAIAVFSLPFYNTCNDHSSFWPILTVFAAALGLMFLIWYLVLNPDRWIDAVVLFIGIVIGVFPSGALIQVVVCLTLAAKRMARQKAIVKNLEAVETLGSTSTICSDKTGTLTMNRMTVAHLWFNNEIHLADVSKEQIVGRKYRADADKTGWTSLVRIAALCSRAVFKPDQEHLDVVLRECIGDGTESGLLKFAARSIGSIELLRKRWPKLAEIPFTSTTKFQVSVHKRLDDGRFLVVMKGAPEKILSKCSTIYLQGNDVSITEDIKDNIHDIYNELAGMGERVVAFAELLLPADKFPPGYRFTADLMPNFPTTGLRFIGLIAMVDPPRPAVPDAVRKCRQAGIRVVMVTGDHPLTAQSIARRVGIIGPYSKTVDDIAKERSIPVSLVDPNEADAVVISGKDLREMTKPQLDGIIARFKEIVFARTSPQQKLFIVEGFQRAGDIVAVTGDGVSDSPAVKQGNVGIAMGISGCDSSKQAADLILLDDNFATIVFAIEEGRRMFDNLKKTVCHILGGNETEIAVPLASVALNIPLPMSTIAMLILSLLTDMVLAVTLAYEDAEIDIMKRKPRNSKTDSLVNNRLLSVSMGMFGCIEICAVFFAYFVVMAESGFLPSDVWGLGRSFDDPGCNNLVDSYGQEWTYVQRKQLQFTLYSVYLLAVVEMQCVSAIACKASRSHLFQQSWRNHYLFFGLVIGVGIMVFLCYCPGVNDTLGLAPLLGCWWLIALPWGLLLIALDQLRKYAIRISPGPNSFGSREMLY